MSIAFPQRQSAVKDAGHHVVFRKPVVADATEVFELVRRTAALDENSWYYYAIFFRDFAETCLVAEVDGFFAGFATGYVLPERPDTLFVWQTATTLEHGVPQLALGLLDELVRRAQRGKGVRYAEASVDQENKAIGMVFRLLGRKLSAPLREEVLFAAELFPGEHHAEKLIVIGPLGPEEAEKPQTAGKRG